MIKRSLARALPALALLSLVLAAPACKKPAEGGSDAPGGDGASSGQVKSDEVMLRYKADAAAKLRESGRLEVRLSGPQSGSMIADVAGNIELSQGGDGKLKVAYAVDEVREITLSGVFEPKPKEGEAPKDPKEELLKAKGAKLVDLRGETDEAGTKALAENKKPEGEGDMTGGLGDILGLPELPEVGLKLGQAVKREVEKQEDLGGLKIPMDEESTYTLVKIDDSSGKRLAEVKIEKEGSGATELPQGGGLLSVDQLAEIVLVFNLDDQLPVSMHVEQTSNFAFGSQGGGETRVVIDATFSPV
ncbi:MAG: hypothetical protein KC420_07345 [Myxococcales bacterium]|nr:hypothetical protein [Myxococcales bacterium]MCB9569707.1 hypothetical protein [Myxococcales bacterium]MCB9700512.1 hypothetical protein [Myxococcales bacterium]